MTIFWSKKALVTATVAALLALGGGSWFDGHGAQAATIGDGGVTLGPCNYSNRWAQTTIYLGGGWYGVFQCTPPTYYWQKLYQWHA